MRRFNRLSINRCIDERSARFPRRGVLTAWATLALIVCLCCVTLAVNSAYVSGLRAEAHRCAQAAALSAARVLLSDDILKSDLQPFEVDARYLEARQAARAVHRVYQSKADLPDFDDGGIAIGTLVSTQQGTMLLQHSTAPNFVEVVLSNAADMNGVGADGSGRLLMAGGSAVSNAKMLSVARVSLQNRLVGFRLSADVPVPMLELAIPDAPHSSETGQWSADIEANGGSDRFEYSRSGNTVNDAADRLPEIVVSVREGSQAAGFGKGCWVRFFPSETRENAIGTDWASGISVSATATSADSMLTFPSQVARHTLRSADVSSMAETFRKVIGRPFLFPLYELPDAGSDASGATGTVNASVSGELTLSRAVAARIVSVEVTNADELRVILQPCVISTSTAVMTTDSTVPENRHVWRIGTTN